MWWRTVKARSLPTATRNPAHLAALGTFVLLDAAVVLLLAKSPVLAVAAAFVPSVLLLIAWAATGDRSVLVLGSFVAAIGPTAFSNSLSAGGALIYPQDILVGVALVGWFVEAAIRRDARSPQRKLVLGISALVFSAAVLEALLRGHVAYGGSLLGQPLRFVLYAGIAAALVQADPGTLFRRITIILYAGVVWQLIAAAYHIATGTSQSNSANLSTGGFRVISILTSLFIASALFAAVVNLELDQPMRKKAVHLSIALLALVEIVLAFSRGTFIATALGLAALFAVLRGARSSFVTILPLALPLVLASAFFLPHLQTRTNEPSLIQTLIQRLDPRVNNDLSVRWRGQADNILWGQVRSNPLFGVGFGKGGQFTLAGVRYNITQDAHNDYLFMLAAGGIVMLAAFLALVANSSLKLLRIARDTALVPHRLFVSWALATLFMLLFNGLVEPLIVLPSILLTIWIIMLLPLAFPAQQTARSASWLRATGYRRVVVPLGKAR